MGRQSRVRVVPQRIDGPQAARGMVVGMRYLARGIVAVLVVCSVAGCAPKSADQDTGARGHIFVGKGGEDSGPRHVVAVDLATGRVSEVEGLTGEPFMLASVLGGEAAVVACRSSDPVVGDWALRYFVLRPGAATLPLTSTAGTQPDLRGTPRAMFPGGGLMYMWVEPFTEEGFTSRSVRVLDIREGEVVETVSLQSTETVFEFGLAASPDGASRLEWLVAVDEETDAPAGGPMILRRAGSTGSTSLAIPESVDYDFAWSQDSRRAAVGTPEGLFVVDARTGAVTRVSDEQTGASGVYDRIFGWTDGVSLLYTGWGRHGRIFEARQDGGAWPVTARQEIPTEPPAACVSPYGDGGVALLTEKGELYIVMPGREPRLVGGGFERTSVLTLLLCWVR